MKGIMIADLVERTMMDTNACVAAVLSGEVESKEYAGRLSSANGSVGEDLGQGLAGVAPLVLSLCKIDRFSEAIKAVQKGLHRGMTNLLT